MEHLSPRLFQQFSALVYEECGINLHDGKKSLLEARLAKRLRATGLPSPKAYYDYILSEEGRDEYIRFFDAVSTNLTYFFREPKHFEFLVGKALPEMVQRNEQRGTSRIRIWSAGCSTGEEPYTIAMSVLENLDHPNRWDFRILATDISTRVLQTAQRGVYDKSKLQNVPTALRQRYFTVRKENSGEKTYEVSPALKRVIAFRRLNLKDPYPFQGPFDVIFCRNVMIYFDKKTQEMLINKMCQYLVPGGYFFVGHSESLTGLDHPMRYIQPAVYQK
ncbi:chemotaxis protein methyltransferase CheR [Desulfacinum hydrothermale DSM 13146]|uniref:protein-glutamate O-methyltransferase n=1 Tax=Desulfacinum hydrothermale DSM 13146 TaxID=1121390 RepID=A0A1W1X7F9_9BACT|nr:protein-glutamate O-methyltransferase [Desulfacinum hydrothermale]SMC19451.1 chemotaxis protein methyltransferase CheR [Desulfacinum hydrothermale DSM 13146]